MPEVVAADQRMARKVIKADRLVADGRMHKIAGGGGRFWIGVAFGSRPYLVAVVATDALPPQAGGIVRFMCQCDDFMHHPAEACKHVIAANKLRMAGS